MAAQWSTKNTCRLTDLQLCLNEVFCSTRLLTEANYKPSLKPAAERWVKQFATRPLHVRLAPNKALHDREIFVDGAEAWNVGQSLKDLAKKSLTGLSLQEGDLGARKIAAYGDIWNTSTPL